MSNDQDADALSIEVMQAGDAPRITAHLMRLSADDRALRFNSALTDEAQIARYVGQMRFGEDLILGLVDAAGRVVGVAHAKYSGRTPYRRSSCVSAMSSNARSKDAIARWSMSSCGPLPL